MSAWVALAGLVWGERGGGPSPHLGSLCPWVKRRVQAIIKIRAPRARRFWRRGKAVLQALCNEGLKVFTSVPSGVEGALFCSVVVLCRHKLALAGYEFCILTLEEKITKQKDLPEDVLPGGTALSAKGFSYLFSISLSLLLLSLLPKHHLHVNPLSSHCISFLLL